MLNRYIINNYKSFDENEIKLSRLNLFSGANSSGKTSAIQALLSGADNLSSLEGKRNIVANRLPPFTFNEVRNYITNAKRYSVTFSDEESNVTIEYLPGDDAFMKTDVCQYGTPSERLFLQMRSSVMYLPAMRSGRLHNSSINPDRERNPLGLTGEYVIDYYYNHHEDIVAENIQETKIRTLEAQVNHWLQRLTGYRLFVAPEGAQYKVMFITKDEKYLYPCHVGTGVSFITEIIITCLSITEGGIVIIENPEIHLHPSAQADMIDFLAYIAKSGRQVIIESHSDHFFNGVRRLLHNSTLELSDVSVYNFVRREDGITAGSGIELSREGGICRYTPGMFEQFDKDLDNLLS